MKILIAANSPGEVAWVKPLALEIQRRGWSCDVILYPCTFATGHEASVLRSFVGVAKVWEPKQVMALALTQGKCYPAETPLLHLGGDLMYSAWMHWRWKWTCWSYLWARGWWDRAYQGYFSRNAQSTGGLKRRRIAAQKIYEVGDLIVDAVRSQVPELPAKDPNLITFLPGSRDEEIRHLIPFYARVAEHLLAQKPQLRFQATLSPFMSPTRLQELLSRPVDPRLDSTPGHFDSVEGAFVCRSGLRIPLLQKDSLQALAASSLAVSIPGTKTAEAACLGVPTLTLVPLNCPEGLPYGGLLGLLDWIPGGSHWKGRWLKGQSAKMGLLAQPNQLLQEAVMPEIIDTVTAIEVAQQVAQLLENPVTLNEKGLRVRQAYQSLGGCTSKMLERLTFRERPKPCGAP